MKLTKRNVALLAALAGVLSLSAAPTHAAEVGPSAGASSVAVGPAAAPDVEWLERSRTQLRVAVVDAVLLTRELREQAQARAVEQLTVALLEAEGADDRAAEVAHRVYEESVRGAAAAKDQAVAAAEVARKAKDAAAHASYDKGAARAAVTRRKADAKALAKRQVRDRGASNARQFADKQATRVFVTAKKAAAEKRGRAKTRALAAAKRNHMRVLAANKATYRRALTASGKRYRDQIKRSARTYDAALASLAAVRARGLRENAAVFAAAVDTAERQRVRVLGEAAGAREVALRAAPQARDAAVEVAHGQYRDRVAAIASGDADLAAELAAVEQSGLGWLDDYGAGALPDGEYEAHVCRLNVGVAGQLARFAAEHDAEFEWLNELVANPELVDLLGVNVWVRTEAANGLAIRARSVMRAPAVQARAALDAAFGMEQAPPTDCS